MSVNWQWNAKFGEISWTQKYHGKERSFVADLYYANCLFCMIHDLPETKEYEFVGFFHDVEHLKRCIGLSKFEGKYDNLYNYHDEYGNKWTEIRLDTSKPEHIPYLTKIGNYLIKAGFRVVYDLFNYCKEE